MNNDAQTSKKMFYASQHLYQNKWNPSNSKRARK